MYKPVIKFASKERARTSLDVIWGRHYTATFPREYKREGNAIRFARKQIAHEYDADVWQLPGAIEMKKGYTKSKIQGI